MNKKTVIGIGAAIVCVLIIAAVLVAKNAAAPDLSGTPEPQAVATASPEAAESGETAEETASPEQEEKVYTPTFMYFVSASDDGHDATMVMIEKLKNEYGEKVKFDIRNIDEYPELTENFPVGDGRTPTLIMLNTKNEISNILFNNSNREDLKAAIDATMN